MDRPSEARARAGSLDWAAFFARWSLGLMFFMGALWRVFDVGPIEHARRFFVAPYAQTFLPEPLLWAAGAGVPFAELVGGALLLLGYRRRWALLVLGSVLLVVTFGHLVSEPLYSFSQHVVPRLALLLFLLSIPEDADRFALDLRVPEGRASGGPGE